MLREAEAPVPEGAWEAISAASQPPLPKRKFGAIAGAAAAVVLLGALVLYSTSREADSIGAAEVNAPKNSTQQQEPPKDSEPAEAANPSEAVRESLPQSEAETSKSNPQDTRPDNGEMPSAAAAEPTGSRVEEPAQSTSFEQTALGAADDPVALREAAPATGEIIFPESIPAPMAAPITSDPAALASGTGQTENLVLHAAIRAENLKGFAPFEIDFEALGTFHEVEWDFGRFGISDEVKTRRTFDQPGTYTVVLTAFDRQGRTVTDMVTVDVREGSNLVVPDSFTPNGDGINDTFKAEGVNLVSYRLTVVDSRGNTIFETRNIEEPWVYGGPPVSNEMDAYFAIIQAEGIDGKTYNIRRRINIIF